MAYRPTTARSEISSAISDDDLAQRTAPQAPALPTAPVIQHGYAHLRGVTYPTNRSTRSPIIPSTTPTSSASRPHSPTSQIGGTHVPSITAQGFLRPLSSARLQAQRLGRPYEETYSPPVAPGTTGSEDNRSVASSRQGPYASLPRSHRTTPSVNTAYSESEAPVERNIASRDLYPLDLDMHQRYYGSSAPSRPQNGPPPPLKLSNSLRVGSIRGDLKSPRSFRSTISFGSKQLRDSGHQQLSSTPNTPKQNEKPTSGFTKQKLGQNYQYFEGNTIFWMGGRLQNARDRPINVATGVIIILPVVLFFVFSASWLWHHVSPALPILFAYIFFICFSSFLHASLVDPGIIPRNSHPFPPDNNDPLQVGPSTNDWVMVRLAGSDTAAMDVPVKYCKSCNIWRPPRCYHCRVCDNCIETLDHHCVWLNNCVGRRNYRYFFTFVSSGTILSLFLAFASLGHVLSYSSVEHVSFVRAIDVCRVPFAMFIYGIIAMSYPSALWLYHLRLTGRGETTREYLASRRFPKEERHRPFTLGNVIKNWTAVFARPKPPTYLHFKKEYEEGDQRFGSRRGQRQAPLTSEAQGGGMEMKPVSGQKGFEGPKGRTKKEPK